MRGGSPAVAPACRGCSVAVRRVLARRRELCHSRLHRLERRPYAALRQRRRPPTPEHDAPPPSGSACRPATSSPRTRRSPRRGRRAATRRSRSAPPSGRRSALRSRPVAWKSVTPRRRSRATCRSARAPPLLRALADLLGELALRALERRLALDVELSGRDLEQRRLPDRLARLADQVDDAFVVGDDRDGARVARRPRARRRAVGVAELVDPHRGDRSLVDGLAIRSAPCPPPTRSPPWRARGRRRAARRRRAGPRPSARPIVRAGRPLAAYPSRSIGSTRGRGDRGRPRSARRVPPAPSRPPAPRRRAAASRRARPPAPAPGPGASSSSSTVRRVVAEAAVARARVGARKARAEQGRQAERERGVGGVERRHPAVPEAGRRAEDARARARRSPRPSRGRAAAASSPPTTLIASCSPPYAGPAVTCPASSPRSRSSATSRDSAPGSAPPASGRSRPAGQVAPRRAAQAAGARWPCSGITSTGAAIARRCAALVAGPPPARRGAGARCS